MAQTYPEQIVSGGQTGVDRGALDAAIALGIAHGGWCPRGRLAEDGVIPPHYQVLETESPRYSVRTRLNVVESSGTLIFSRGLLQGGTELTYRLAQQYGKPCHVVDFLKGEDADTVHRWLQREHVRILNVAGPRESSAPGIAAHTRRFLIELLAKSDCNETRSRESEE